MQKTHYVGRTYNLLMLNTIDILHREEWLDFSTRHFSSQRFIPQEALGKRLGGFTAILDMVVTPLSGI
jgi:hypothetical protein